MLSPPDPDFVARDTNRTTELPNDPALPALAAIRAVGLSRAFPALGLDGDAVELRLHRYHAGRRAAIEARVGRRRFAIKVSADDPTREAEIHAKLAESGLSGESGVRVPPLLAFNRDLRAFVIGWLDGPSAVELIEGGQGERAGELAATWFHRTAMLEVKLGSPLGGAPRLMRARKWAGQLISVNPSLETETARAIRLLEQTQPDDGTPRLVNGGLYAEHVLDLGGGPGVIDWGRFGQGPAELDAGILLATIWQLGFRDDSLAGAAARAEKVFFEETEDLIDPRALTWHRAVELLRFAKDIDRRKHRKPAGQSRTPLCEAIRLLETAREAS